MWTDLQLWFTGIIAVSVAFQSYQYLNDTHRGLSFYEKSPGFIMLRSGVAICGAGLLVINGMRFYEWTVPPILATIVTIGYWLVITGLLWTHRKYVNSETDKENADG